jgi:hypothetical protein
MRDKHYQIIRLHCTCIKLRVELHLPSPLSQKFWPFCLSLYEHKTLCAGQGKKCYDGTGVRKQQGNINLLDICFSCYDRKRSKEPTNLMQRVGVITRWKEGAGIIISYGERGQRTCKEREKSKMKKTRMRKLKALSFKRVQIYKERRFMTGYVCVGAYVTH